MHVCGCCALGSSRVLVALVDSLEAEGAAAAAASHHISPDRCEQRTQRNVTAAFLSHSDTSCIQE